jgi:hypothetical protein
MEMSVYLDDRFVLSRGKQLLVEVEYEAMRPT